VPGEARLVSARHSQGLPDVPLIGMDGANLLTDHPRFQWIPVKDANRYWLVLLPKMETSALRKASLPQLKRKTYWWQMAVSTCAFAYPRTKLPLQPGDDYSLVICALHGEREIARGVATFAYLSAADRALVNAFRQDCMTFTPRDDMVTAHLLLASYYRMHDIYDQAVVEYQQVLNRHPQAKAVHYALLTLYRQTRRWENAKREWQCIKSLG